MPAGAETAGRDSHGFFGWLTYELAAKEGRAAAVARMAAASTITVAIAMVFRIPEPTYMAYIVFLVSKDERSGTLRSAMGGLAAVTIAIIATLGLSLIDLSEPALRLPAMAGMTFLAMYSVRVFALGPITYLAGFVIVLLQSVVDDVPSPERLTRLSLWTWVVLLVPILTTVTLNILFAPDVGVLRKRDFRRILTALARGWRGAPASMPLDRHRERVVELLDKAPAHGSSKRKPTDVTDKVLQRLLDLLVLLEAVMPQIPTHRRLSWASRLEQISAAGDGPLPASAGNPSSAQSQEMRPAESAVDSAIGSMVDAFQEAESESTVPVRRPMLAADATSNPAHWQFGFKTMFAVMIVYAIYSLLDWPGLRTSIVTCFFVALGSLGETVHKLTLRISGAVIGGLLAGLCIVFVLPHCTDIGQLCLIIAAVSAVAAWVATSSEQLSYAGLQIAFAFFLGVLQGYAPATDLTVLRDRVIGILLGNVVMTIVFSTFWPQSAALRVRPAIGQVLRSISVMLASPSSTASGREQAARGLVLAERFRTLRGFELQLVPGHASVERMVASLRCLVLLESHVFVADRQFSPKPPEEVRQVLSRWASDSALAAETGVPWPAVPTLTGPVSAAVDEVVLAAKSTVEAVNGAGP